MERGAHPTDVLCIPGFKVNSQPAQLKLLTAGPRLTYWRMNQKQNKTGGSNRSTAAAAAAVLSGHIKGEATAATATAAAAAAALPASRRKQKMRAGDTRGFAVLLLQTIQTGETGSIP